MSIECSHAGDVRLSSMTSKMMRSICKLTGDGNSSFNLTILSLFKAFDGDMRDSNEVIVKLNDAHHVHHVLC